MSAIPTRCLEFSSLRLSDGGAQHGPLIANWRVTTTKTQTVDEYGVLFRNLFAMNGLEVESVQGIVISSVVPPLDSTLREVCEQYFQSRPLFIEPGVKTGMPVHYDNPAEVGADRIVNSVAAFEKFGGPCIIVDFGTATTFDVVSKKGEYLGGVITPGHRHLGRRVVFAHGAIAARGCAQASAGAGDEHGQQRAVGSVLRIPGIDRRHS